MPGTGRTYYVAGAGIAGLTLALALAKFGATVIVLERNPVISEFGAGLQISPNAWKVLAELGLHDALSARSFEPAGIDLYPHRRATPLVTLELGGIVRQRFGAPYSVMHRADLADALHKACRRFANVDILFGVRGWEVVSHARGVTVTVDEANGQTRTGRAHGFIGADGVHSRTRTEIIGGPPATDRHRIAWRTLLPFNLVAGQVSLDLVSIFFAPDCHLVCYPLPHRRQVNLALFARAPGTTRPAGRPLVGKGLQHSPRIEVLLSAAGDTWTPWPLFTVDALRWHGGNIGLVGDAAHAMAPFQAQGAAMAIEDAAVLAPLLMAEPKAEAALRKFELVRRSRVNRVARLSAANGRVFHLPWPLSSARDTVIRLQGTRGHLRRLGWLYGHQLPISATLEGN